MPRLTRPTLATAAVIAIAASGAQAPAGAQGDMHHHPDAKKRAAYPNLAAATPRQRAQARLLWRRSKASARRSFRTFSAALRRGYRPRIDLTTYRRPAIFHLKPSRPGAGMDPARPPALVYYQPTVGDPVLIALMFRARRGRVPRLGGRILDWHGHAHGTTVMTHVWLTNQLRSAFARCLPVRPLEAAIPGFRWEPREAPGNSNTRPCP
jgi:hypothetical protein